MQLKVTIKENGEEQTEMQFDLSTLSAHMLCLTVLMLLAFL